MEPTSVRLVSTCFEILTQHQVEGFYHLLLLELWRPQGDQLLLLPGQVRLSQQVPTLDGIRKRHIVLLKTPVQLIMVCNKTQQGLSSPSTEVEVTIKVTGELNTAIIFKVLVQQFQQVLEGGVLLSL